MGQQVISLGPNENYERPGYAHIRKMTQKHRERLRKNFKKGRDLLLKKGVPFEPNDLLEHNWPKFTASAEWFVPRLLKDNWTITVDTSRPRRARVAGKTEAQEHGESWLHQNLAGAATSFMAGHGSQRRFGSR
jgi:hypothetical protein